MASNDWGGGLVMRCGRALSLLVAAMAAAVGLGVFTAGPASAAQATQVRFAESSLQAAENQGQVHVLVERVDLPVSRLVVHYRTEGVASSAEPGVDYVHGAGSLVFDVGVRSTIFTVWLLDDDLAEETEHVLLHLETSSGTGPSTRLTILDEDVREAVSSSEPPSTVSSPRRGAGTPGGSPSGPVVVASSAGSSRPVAHAAPRVRPRVVARPAPPRRIILQQTPATPFELRPTGGSGPYGDGLPTAVDPLLALGAGLLLARVGAEAWFRSRIAPA